MRQNAPAYPRSKLFYVICCPTASVRLLFPQRSVFPAAIATEAFMSFIGLGVRPPMPSWGILSNEGIGAIRSSPYQILLPSIAISLTMFAFNFLGDGLRDALDPRLRK